MIYFPPQPSSAALLFHPEKNLSGVSRGIREYVSSSYPLGDQTLISTLELVIGMVAGTCPQTLATLLKFPEESFLSRKNHMMSRRRGEHRALEKVGAQGL